MQPRRAGFTLIELLTVIVIVGILAAFGISFLWQSKDRGLVATMQSDLRTLSTHQESYFGKNLTYAAALGDLTEFAASPGVTVTITAAGQTGWAGISQHPGVVGRQCGMFVGAALAADGAPATIPGTVACDP